MKSGLEKFRGGFNSEPNKRLRLTSPLASRGIGLRGWGWKVWEVWFFTTEYTEAVEPFLKTLKDFGVFCGGAKRPFCEILW